MIDTTAPAVSSIVRAGADPTSGPSVDFTVTFSEGVTGVDTADFILWSTGTAAGAVSSAAQVTASVYTVTVTGVSGDGQLRLDLDDDDSIVDQAGSPLGGAGAQDYTAGEAYTVTPPSPTVVASDPADGATGVLLGASVSVTFSQEMDQTETGNAFSITGGVTGAMTWSADGLTLTFTPDAMLAEGTSYAVTIGTGAMDTGGVHLAEDYTLTFTTRTPSGGLFGGGGCAAPARSYRPEGSSAPAAAVLLPALLLLTALRRPSPAGREGDSSS